MDPKGPENIVLDLLRALRSDVQDVKEEMRGMHNEMRALKQHMAAFMTHETNQDADIAAMKVRLERIERRLELVSE